MTSRARSPFRAAVLSSLRLVALPLALAGVTGCQRSGAPATSPAIPEGQEGLKLPSESHFGSLVQLTDGGDNAEPYWAFGGTQLTFQAHDRAGCNQVYTLSFDGPLPEPRQVSSGKGASMGARFLPGDQELVYASTELGEAACPAALDGNPSNAWSLSPGFDLVRASLDGSNRRLLTGAVAGGPSPVPSYDGEASVCAKDGSILFTSSRDGDVELYRMDASGQNVQRITSAPGYDGRAFFSQDCERIVWQASRPTGKALADYQQLLGQGLVRPTNLEIFVAKADGSEARQITYFGAQSFTPYFAPAGERVLFSSNVGDPQRQEFDIWAINVDGSGLERISYAPGFDGYPMFSPDGKHLAFASARGAQSKAGETNVFVGEWQDAPVQVAQESAADRVIRDIRWLADPAREGRGVGTPGLEASGAYIEAQFRALGLEPAAGGTSYRQPFDVVTGIQSGPSTRLVIGKDALSTEQFQPLGYSASGEVSGKLVLASYGLQKPELGRKDYDGVAAKGNIVVVRRFVPESEQFKDDKLRRLHGDLRAKAWTARARGAAAMIVVDSPERPANAKADWAPPDDASFPKLVRDSYGDAGIPVVIVKRAAFAPVLEQLEKGRSLNAQLKVELNLTHQTAFNVLARLPARAPAAQRLPGAFLVGAHYDHLGHGGSFSMAPGDDSPHVGADDNASGVSLVLELARHLSQSSSTRRDIVFATFSGEEMGVLGSSHLIKNPPPGLEPANLHAMLNFDMVGRLTQNELTLLGAESADEWQSLLPPLCAQTQLNCHLGGAGVGGSDHSPFYEAKVPVLHFFTGTHADYHKPSDLASKINAAGVAQVTTLASLVLEREAQPGKLTYKHGVPADMRGDQRSFNASLGTIPDYAGPPNGQKGVLLSGVRPGSGAALGGIQRGDILVQLGPQRVDSVQDLMFSLNEAKPHETVTAVVLRDGKRVELKVTYQERGGGAATNPHAAPQQPGGAAPSPAGTHGAPHSAGSPGAHTEPTAPSSSPKKN
jgi:Tol biopolymer transport system component